MKKLLFTCMVLASVLVPAGCSKAPQPPADEEAKEYIKKILTAHGREFLKEKNDKLVSSNEIYDHVEVVSISGGYLDSRYYGSPQNFTMSP